MSRSDISHMYPNPNIYLLTSERAGDLLNQKLELSPLLLELKNLEISLHIYKPKMENKDNYKDNLINFVNEVKLDFEFSKYNQTFYHNVLKNTSKVFS